MPDFTPADFSEIFLPDERPILVGGQAVNLWAEVYFPTLKLLQNYAPFTSMDADIFGPPALGASIAMHCGWSLRTNHEPRNPISAILTKETEKGQLRVDVLRSILGVSADEIEKTVGTYEITPGKICRVPAPYVLLKAKIANLHQLDNTRNDGSPRNDLKHVSMLILICGHYIFHLAQSARSGSVKERDLINALHNLHAVIHSAPAVEVAGKYNLDFSEALPLDLDVAGLPKLANFYANLRRQYSAKNQ